jgi:membrane-bound metal-dependent hydrolase YbcI (DUF457 family)
MTWASHIIVGSATAKVFGLNYILTTLGAILPDLAEMITPKRVQHRGITHSIALWLASLVLLWSTPIRDCLLGVVIGHLFMDSLTVMGVPILDENSRRITILGGRIRTASAGEFAISGIIAFVAFVMLGSFTLDASRRDWRALHDKRVIDRKEYYDNRFKVF